jgi:hypothetical protein
MIYVTPLIECHDGVPPKIESYAMHEADSMRTLEIPEKTFFWNGMNFTRQSLQPECSTGDAAVVRGRRDRLA